MKGGAGLNEKNILIGKQAIMDFIGINSPDLFALFITKGMPARLIRCRWYAHAENIDRWFRTTTNVKNAEIPADAE